jgi:hypothetical protein
VNVKWFAALVIAVFGMLIVASMYLKPRAKNIETSHQLYALVTDSPEDAAEIIAACLVEGNSSHIKTEFHPTLDHAGTRKVYFLECHEHAN